MRYLVASDVLRRSLAAAKREPGQLEERGMGTAGLAGGCRGKGRGRRYRRPLLAEPAEALGPGGICMSGPDSLPSVEDRLFPFPCSLEDRFLPRGPSNIFLRPKADGVRMEEDNSIRSEDSMLPFGQNWKACMRSSLSLPIKHLRVSSESSSVGSGARPSGDTHSKSQPRRYCISYASKD